MECQKAHTAAMRKRRWLPKSHTETEVIDPPSRCVLSRARKEHKREVKKIKKLEYNTRRREQRTWEALGESREALEESWEELEESQNHTWQEAVEATEVRYESQPKKLRGEKEVAKTERPHPPGNLEDSTRSPTGPPSWRELRPGAIERSLRQGQPWHCARLGADRDSDVGKRGDCNGKNVAGCGGERESVGGDYCREL